MARFSVTVPDPLHAALVAEAAREGRSLSDVVAEGAQRWCEARGAWPPGGGVPKWLLDDLARVVPRTQAGQEIARRAASTIPRGAVVEMMQHLYENYEVVDHDFCARFGIDLREVERG